MQKPEVVVFTTRYKVWSRGRKGNQPRKKSQIIKSQIMPVLGYLMGSTSRSNFRKPVTLQLALPLQNAKPKSKSLRRLVRKALPPRWITSKQRICPVAFSCKRAAGPTVSGIKRTSLVGGPADNASCFLRIANRTSSIPMSVLPAWSA